jgi:hypothetical protein
MSEIDPNAALSWLKQDVKCKNDDESQRPGPRSGHSLTVVGVNAFVFGGLCETGVDDIEDSTYTQRPINK